MKVTEHKNERKYRAPNDRFKDAPTQVTHGHLGGLPELTERSLPIRPAVRRKGLAREIPLDIYLAKGAINKAQYASGIRFRSAYLDVTLGSGGYGVSEDSMLGNIQSRRALKQMAGVLSESQRSIVLSVCGQDICAGDTARVQTLCRALNSLCTLFDNNDLDRTAIIRR